MIFLLPLPHFNCICRAFLKPRCKIAWAACYSTALPEPTISPTISHTAVASLFVIDTAFDFSLKENSSTAGRYNEKDQQDQFKFTQTQRIFAEQAVRTASLSDLRQKVSLDFFINRFPNSDYPLMSLDYTTTGIGKKVE